MNHFQQQQQQQTHVAQQSRREKLRILHPSSPQSGNHSDHSAGSASAVLEARQGAGDQDNFNGSSTGGARGYHPGQSINDVLPYQNVISATDAYSFPAGSELLAYTAKANGFMGSAGSDMLPPQAPLATAAGYSNQAGVVSKSWSSSGGINGQLGHYNGTTNPLSIAGSGIQGSPLQVSSSASNAVAATLLNSLQGSQQQQQQLGRDGPMASYLSGQNAQAEAMQLFLTGYQGYSDPSTPGNMVLISPSSGSSVQSSHLASSGAPGQQHFIGIPLTPSSLSQQDTSAGNGLPSNAFASRGGASSTYSNWRNGGDEFLFLPSSEATQQRKSISSEAGGLNQITDLSEYALRQPSLSSMLGQQQSLLQAGHRLEIDNSHQGVAGPAYQSLSLSLSNPSAPLHALDSGMSSPGSQEAKRAAGQAVGKLPGDLSHFRTSPRDTLAGASYGNLTNSTTNKHVYFDAAGPSSAVSNSFSFVSGSRYLRAAQQLLDEVCSVGRGLKQASKTRGSQGPLGGQSSPAAVTSSLHKEGALTENSVKSEITMGSSAVASPGTGPPTASAIAPATTAESKENIAVLTPEERQEYEGKKTKLLAMLQEVDRRYRQYYDQMQVVITSFDAVAGAGAATPYTALALQAMSRYFRCLRDAITGQIQNTCKALGEEDVTKSITSRPLTSRLRFIDQQIRQQRAYQQYGMLQQHAWRPQRGLPERSVSILRAWLFEHFLHPYPKDADKMMLARQTGLSRGQVSNWFINARVRLWKPMVEEMYQEEIKEQELASVRLTGDPDDKHNHGGGESMTNDRSDRQDLGAGLVVVEKMQMDHGNSEHQSYSSDYGMMTMRKADSQMFGEAQAQLKKTRLGMHDTVGLLAEGGNMDVDMKSDGGEGMCVPGASPLERHYVHEHFAGVHQNGPMHHPDSFESRNFGRYSHGGFGSQQQYPGNSGVSLTLGLRNCDNLQQQLAGAAQQSFLAAGQNFLGGGRNNSTGHHHHIPHADNNDLCNIYENATAVGGGLNATAGHLGAAEHHEGGGIDYQGRKQPHMESHLLHDFVA